MLRILTFVFFAFFLMACGEKTATSKADTQKPAPNSTGTPAPTATGYTNPYPSITDEKMMDLWNNCTLVDYLFYEHPISMNMNDKPGIQSALRQISGDPAKVLPSCKPTGRVFYQNNGETQAEADFYFSPRCVYFVFMENNKPIAGNQMTAEGVEFFKSVLANAQNAGQ